MAAYLGKFVSW